MKTTENTKALFYKPTDRWQIWVSLAATILIYLTALALAAHPPEVAPLVSPGPDVIDVIYSDESADQPPAVEETPEVTPPPPDLQPEFMEDNPTPAPVQKHREVSHAPPLVKSSPSFGVAGATS